MAKCNQLTSLPFKRLRTYSLTQSVRHAYIQVCRCDESRGRRLGAAAQTERNVSHPTEHQPFTTRRTHTQLQVSLNVPSAQFTVSLYIYINNNDNSC